MTKTSDKTLFRPTWATIDLGALSHNFSVIEQRLSGRAKVMAMVKADAYGHGAVQVSKVLERCGVRALGVATVEEGMELRAAGIDSQVLAMGGLMGVGSMASKAMIEADLTPVIHSAGVLESLEADASKARKKVGVHLKLDTGMARLGVRMEALPSVLSQLKRCEHLFVEGVMTHLAEADHADVSAAQMRRFESGRDLIERELGRVPIWHIANSAAVIRGEPVDVPGAKEVWARPGLALYGDLNGVDPGGADLMPVMGLVSRAVLIKHVPAGTRVSYGGTYTTARPSRLSVVSIGYADGYPWAVSGKAFVLIRGKRVPVAGRVTMDMIVIDVTDVPDVTVGDEVVLLGAQGKERITLSEIAIWAGTITYEVLCGISKRMPRVYNGTWKCHPERSEGSR